MAQYKAQIKSLKSIMKITGAMKAVSAAKAAKAEKELAKMRQCGEAAKGFYEKNEVYLPENVESKTLYVGITSDRGLCGSCNTQICRWISRRLENEQPSSKSSLICVGNIGTNILKTYHPNLIVLSVDKVGRQLPTFLDASGIAQHIREMEDNISSGQVVFNECLHISIFRIQLSPVHTTATVFRIAQMSSYGGIDTETAEDYGEFSTAMILFHAMREAYASEQGARLAAMDQASQNASKISKKLQIAANRARQASVTKELIEIVSAALALESGN